MTDRIPLGEPADFVSQPSTIKGRMSGAMSGIFSPGDLAQEELGDVNWGVLHTYMTRRFGPPNIGCDPYKEISQWIITTPQTGLHLSVRIAPHDTTLLFGYMIEIELDEGMHQAKWARDEAKRQRFTQWCLSTHGRKAPSWEMHEAGIEGTYEERREAQAVTSKWYDDFAEQDVEPDADDAFGRAETALRRTLRDLTRSVGVRDQDISALGVVDGDEHSVEYTPHAGMAPPAIAFDEGMWEIYGAINRLGGGQEGLAKLKDIVLAAVPIED